MLYDYQPLAAIVMLSERFHNFFVSEILRYQNQDVQIEVLHRVIQVRTCTLRNCTHISDPVKRFPCAQC